MYKDEKRNNTLKASTERVGHDYSADSRNCIKLSKLNLSVIFCNLCRLKTQTSRDPAKVRPGPTSGSRSEV